MKRRHSLKALFAAVPLAALSICGNALADDSSTTKTQLANLEAKIGELDNSILQVAVRKPKEPSHQERLEAINAKLAEMEASIDSVAEQAGDKSTVKSGSSKSTMKVSGRVHFDGWGFDKNDASIADINGQDPENRLGFRR